MAVARHQVAQKELAAIQDEIQKKKQRVIRYAAQLRRSQEVCVACGIYYLHVAVSTHMMIRGYKLTTGLLLQDIANVLKKHQTVLQHAKQKTKGGACIIYCPCTSHSVLV